MEAYVRLWFVFKKKKNDVDLNHITVLTTEATSVVHDLRTPFLKAFSAPSSSFSTHLVLPPPYHLSLPTSDSHRVLLPLL